MECDDWRFIVDQFLKRPLTPGEEALPEEMKLLVGKIAVIENQKEALEYAYEVLAKKYRGYRLLIFLRLDRFFITDIGTLWKKNGFLHCNHMNYLLRMLLVASGQFAAEDIEAHWTQIWFFSPHQYLIIHLHGGEAIEVDLWGKVYGIPFETHAHGLQGGTTFASQLSKG
ncbi:MAG: hypothetical protein Q8O53_02750 [Candidatus Moranbacteria bacterium]|nr:hypothetical protein [Candidatus Moranbacteria bacterium]